MEAEAAEEAEEEAEEEAGYRIKNKNPTQRCGEKMKEYERDVFLVNSMESSASSPRLSTLAPAVLNAPS